MKMGKIVSDSPQALNPILIILSLVCLFKSTFLIKNSLCVREYKELMFSEIEKKNENVDFSF